MNFRQSLDYLDSFQNFEWMLPFPNRGWNLARMRALLEIFGHPEKKWMPVLIAGTKGKGSTGFFLESILMKSGIRCGFYCSPHLETPLERIRICGKPVSREKWSRGLEQIRRGLRREWRHSARLRPVTDF